MSQVRDTPVELSQRVLSPYCPALSWRFFWLGEGGQIDLDVGSYDHSVIPSRKHLRGMARYGVNVWRRNAGGVGTVLAARDLLDFLARKWSVLVSDFLVQPEALDEVVDFGEGLGRPDLPKLQLHIKGRHIIVLADGWELDPLAEALMIAESLLVLGQELAAGLSARGLGHAEVAAWARARTYDNLPPTESEDDYSLGLDPVLVASHSAYYARRLSLPIERYRLVALWEDSHHILRSMGNSGEADIQALDGLKALYAGTFPTEAVVLDRARRAAAMFEQGSFEEWCLNSEESMNRDMRGYLFYRDWPKRSEIELDGGCLP
jgi:hypothetical protein